MKFLLLLGLFFTSQLYAQKPCGFKNGLQEGVCKQFYSNGVTSEITTWKKGKLDGKAEYFYENGKKKAEGYNKKNFKVKTWTYYFKDGKISGKENWVYRDHMSVLEGEYIKYYENGKISEKTTYKNGKIHGDFIAYDKNGKLLNSAKVINGITNSLKIFREDGITLFAEGPMDINFEKTGEWIYYKKDGKTPDKIISFRNGKKTSERKYK